MTKVVIDNVRLNHLRGQPDIVAKFPFLGMTIARASGGCCHKNNTVVPDYDGIRRAIGALDETKRKELKDAIGAETLLVFVPTGSKVEAIEF